MMRFFAGFGVVLAALQGLAAAEPGRFGACAQYVTKELTLTPAGGVLPGPNTDLTVRLRLSTTVLPGTCTPTIGTLSNLSLDFGDGTTEQPFAGTVGGMVGTQEFNQTFTHRYAAPGNYTVRFTGAESYGGGTPFDFAISAAVVVEDPPRVPPQVTLTPIAAVNSIAADWSPRWIEDDSVLLFLSERGGRSALYQSPRVEAWTFGAPTEVAFDPPPPGPLGGFEVSPDGLMIIARIVTEIGLSGRGQGDYYRATRPSISGPFGSFSRLTFRYNGVNFPTTLAGNGNEFRAARHLSLSADGSLVVPAYVLYPTGGADRSLGGPFYRLVPVAETATYDLAPGVVWPDGLGRLQSQSGAVRLWTVPDAVGTAADGKIFAVADGAAPGVSVYEGAASEQTEAKLRFTTLETLLFGATAYDIGSVSSDGSAVVLSATLPVGTSEEDVFLVGF